ncbi:hypothetical protein E4Z66_18825 [Aliishimia ponticola]|uniref:Uncharacterized protein n=1 Tax=Aliishimia ponticola TaxID=2499833 RepID=A0A4V3XJU7_9RHOB|nr:hypothetical protein [Aliishimia ponticola]THH34483.1 hypothetical protein E4Z66_18825 [Aliishimia ponticola]
MSFDTPEWQRRLAEAREARAKVLAERSGASAPPAPESAAPITAMPEASKSEAFAPVVPGSEPTAPSSAPPTPLSFLQPPELAPPPAPPPPSRVQRHTATFFGALQGVGLGLLIALVGLMALTLLLPGEPVLMPGTERTDLASLPAPIARAETNLVARAQALDLGVGQDAVAQPGGVPAGTGREDLNLVLILAAQHEALSPLFDVGQVEIRTTPLDVPHSTVQFFNDADAAVAQGIADSLGATLVDLRGAEPSQPVGTITVYLAHR